MLSEIEWVELQQAKNLLESPGLVAKMSNALGGPIEQGFTYLPKSWNQKIGDVTQMALNKASDAAIFTLKENPGKRSSNAWHKVGVAVSGGIGGFLGLSALAIELPISTSIMLRSIADIARSEGAMMSDVETKLACLEVLALGGRSADDDGVDSAYFSVRTMLSKSMSDAAQYLAHKHVIEQTAPPVLRLVSMIAERFGMQITQKAAAQLVPVIGGFSGAVINTLFIGHFQSMARGHFIVCRLERLYGKDTIRNAYDSLPILS